MPLQFHPATRVSTDIHEFESYLRQAAEFVGQCRRNPYGTRGAANKKDRFRDVLLRSGVTRRGTIARPKSC